MCPTTSHSLTISTDDWLSLGHLVILSDFCGCFVFCAAADFNNCFITTWMASSSGQFGWPAGVTSRPANKELVYLYLFFLEATLFMRNFCWIVAAIDRSERSLASSSSSVATSKWQGPPLKFALYALFATLLYMNIDQITKSPA